MSSPSHTWWRSLSLYEMDELTKKYYPECFRFFVSQIPSLVKNIYEKECKKA